MVVVEDLYRPYRPKRKTRASVAQEKGLDGLAQFILAQETAEPIENEAVKYMREDADEAKSVRSAAEALQGAKDIIAEAIYHNEVAQPTEIQKSMVQELSKRAAAHARRIRFWSMSLTIFSSTA